MLVEFVLVAMAAPSSPAKAVDEVLASPRLADGEQPSDGGNRQDDLVVTGRRMRGAVIGDFPIEVELSQAELRALGASSIGSLVEALSPRTGGRGADYAPVLLLNGRRVTNTAEIEKLPPEAIERLDILGEEAAMSFGYRPGRKVLNIVLRENFTATTSELSHRIATSGGYGKSAAELSYVRIAGPSRLSVDIKLEKNSSLRESERGIPADPPSVAPAGLEGLTAREAEFRTLLPRSRSGELGVTYSRPVSGAVNLTVGGRVTVGQARSLFGLPFELDIAPGGPGAERPLVKSLRTRTSNVEIGLDGDLDQWNWTFTGNWRNSLARTLSDGDSDPLFDQAERRATLVADSFEGLLVARGPILTLPAGTSWLNLRLGASAFRLNPTVRDGTTISTAHLSRDQGLVRGSLELPLIGKKSGILSKLGEVSASLGLELREVSDFKTMSSTAFHFSWRPDQKLSFQASLLRDQQPPSMQQLGAPLIVTPSVRLFDFVRGDAAEVTQSEGGNPSLREERYKVFQLGVVYKPFSGNRSLSLGMDYKEASTRNWISELFSATAEVQAAFPNRFGRDNEGRLVSFDATPVNFARVDSKLLHWIVQFDLSLTRQGADENGAENRSERPPGRIIGSLAYDLRLEDEAILRQGLSPIDYLGGAPKGFPGNVPKHTIQGQLGYYKSGMGAQTSFAWQNRSILVNFGPSGSGEVNRLIFKSRLRVDASAFLDLEEQAWLAGRSAWAKGLRVSLSLENLFDAKLRVRDASGTTPFSYLPPFLDPVGRSFQISLRKQF